MSFDASRARMVGPLVWMVASATWLSAILGFFSAESSNSMRAPSDRYFDSRPIFSSAYASRAPVTVMFRPLTVRFTLSQLLGLVFDS